MYATQEILFPLDDPYDIKSTSIGTTNLDKGKEEKIETKQQSFSYKTTWLDLGDNRATEKVATCGQKIYTFVQEDNITGDLDLVDFKNYCDNRICQNPDCQEHRKYKYKKEHNHQINHMANTIRVPKAFLYSFPKKPAEDITKEYITRKCNKVYKNLRKYSKTEFSQHEEVKLYPDFYDIKNPICKKCHDRKLKNCNTHECKWAGFAFLHFHVVSGFISNIKQQRADLGCHIGSQKAINQGLENYISKYASKTPYFVNDFAMYYYHQIVYKAKMHKYSFRATAEPIISRYSYHMFDWKWVDLAGEKPAAYFDPYIIEKEYVTPPVENPQYIDDPEAMKPLLNLKVKPMCIEVETPPKKKDMKKFRETCTFEELYGCPPEECP